MKEIIKKYYAEVLEKGRPIMKSWRFGKAEHTVHHLTTTVAEHSIRVACAALCFAKHLNRHGFHIDEDEAVRSALLHDIGMTEDDVRNSPFIRKCFLHPIKSADIACMEYHASADECDAILHHMWPSTIVPPSNMLGWVLIAADKYCSVYEVSHPGTAEPLNQT